MGEHFSLTGPICPHCEHHAHADDAFFFDEDFCEHECSECGRGYHVSTHVQWSWTTRKAGDPA